MCGRMCGIAYQDGISRQNVRITICTRERSLYQRSHRRKPPFTDSAGKTSVTMGGGGGLETALELESFQLASRHRNRLLSGSMGPRAIGQAQRGIDCVILGT